VPKNTLMRTDWRVNVAINIPQRRFVLALAVSVLFLRAPSPCHAGLLPVTFATGGPIVSGSNGGITYNASTGDFNATLTTPTLTLAAPFVNPPPGHNFALITTPKLVIDLTVDQSGNFVANGTGLALTGKVSFTDQFGGTVTFGTSSTSVLLQGTVTAFGAQPAGPPSLTFDGYYTITGGALTTMQTDSLGNSVFGGFPVGFAGGFLLDAENVTGGTLGNFAANFSSSSDKPTVGVLAPEPRTLALLSIGTALLLRRKNIQEWGRTLCRWQFGER
jgi:hypothetical protein